jgi:hypothetical protein
MKYLSKFESYNQEVPINLSDISSKTSDYLKLMDNSDKNVVRRDLEKFAIDHGVTFDDLQDPELVKSLLMGVDENFGDWFSKNWHTVVDKLSKYLRISSLITFVGSLVGYYSFGMDTMTGIKVAVAAYIISNVVACLKGLK